MSIWRGRMLIAFLFVVYFLSQLLILSKKEDRAFTLVAINLLFSLLVLLYHSTDLLKIRL